MDFNINFNLGGLAKLFKKGKIDDLYFKMYKLAEEIAIHETGQYYNKLLATKNESNKESFIEKVHKNKQSRIKYHYEEMKKLLELYLKDELK